MSEGVGAGASPGKEPGGGLATASTEKVDFSKRMLSYIERVLLLVTAEAQEQVADLLLQQSKPGRHFACGLISDVFSA